MVRLSATQPLIAVTAFVAGVAMASLYQTMSELFGSSFALADVSFIRGADAARQIGGTNWWKLYL